MNGFELEFVAGSGHIDFMGHVNNAVWLEWVQDIAIAHWEAVAPDEHRERYLWVVTRHEIDYRGNVREGEAVMARTFIPDPPRGARFDRHVEFRDAGGKVIVKAKSTWAMIERGSGRLARVTPEIAAPFYDG